MAQGNLLNILMICENASSLFYIRWSGSQMLLLEFNI